MHSELVNDATLLQRYVSGREEAAFEELVQRHGPLVLKVCRRFLQSEHDVEDVFQVSFLLLAHKASAVSWNGSVGGWLHHVARRLALKTRSGASRRRGRERLSGALIDGPSSLLADEFHPRSDAQDEIERRELRHVLDDAVRQLPEKYRVPVMLCYLEGKTNEEAARQLGWPAGSMSRRLKRARSLLRQRLAHSGLMIAGLLFTAFVILRVPQMAPQDRSERFLVRQSMRSFRPSSPEGADWRAALAAAARADHRPGDADQVEELARQARQVAAEIADHDPGGNHELWQYHVAGMQRAACDLSTAARQSNQVAMLTAARRLDSTCVSCHVAFRARTDLSPEADSRPRASPTAF